MPEQREILNANEIRKFTNELTYRRYLLLCQDLAQNKMRSSAG